MQNIQNWRPTKIIRIGDKYKPRLDSKTIQSYFICNAQVDHYVRYIRKYSKGRLLDCGCGNVPYYEIYQNLVEEVICTDWKNSMHENKFVDVYSDLNEHLEFEDLSFDTIILTDVLEHIYKPLNLIAEINRVLKPGGRIIVAVPFFYWIHEQPYDYFRYTEYSLSKMFEDSGFKIIEIEPYGGYLDVLLDTINKVFIRRKYQLKIFLPFSNLIKRSFLNRKINKALQNKYPLGYILCCEKIEIPV